MDQETLQKSLQVFENFKVQVKSCNTPQVKELLEQYPDYDLANRVDPETRQTSIFFTTNYPIEDSQLECIKVLIDIGKADPNFQDGISQTVMFYICKDGKEKVFDYLMQHNADINHQDVNGQTALFFASRDNRVNIVRKMIEKGVNCYQIDLLQKQTALYYAAREGNTEICKLLIEAGCKVLHQDSQRKTALSFAKKANKKETVDLLQNYQQKEKEDQKQNQESNLNKKRKKDDLVKMKYKLIFTNEKGEINPVTENQFKQLKEKFPAVAQFLENPDQMITDELMISTKDKFANRWEKVAKKVLTAMQKSKLGGVWFAQPVDIKKFTGIEDYYDIIKKPMDYSTLKTKLNNNVYNNVQEFNEDMLLIYSNCVLYNGEKSEIGQIGVKSREEYLKVCEENGLNNYIQNVIQQEEKNDIAENLLNKGNKQIKTDEAQNNNNIIQEQQQQQQQNKPIEEEQQQQQQQKEDEKINEEIVDQQQQQQNNNNEQEQKNEIQQEEEQQQQQQNENEQKQEEKTIDQQQDQQIEQENQQQQQQQNEENKPEIQEEKQEDQQQQKIVEEQQQQQEQQENKEEVEEEQQQKLEVEQQQQQKDKEETIQQKEEQEVQQQQQEQVQKKDDEENQGEQQQQKEEIQQQEGQEEQQQQNNNEVDQQQQENDNNNTEVQKDDKQEQQQEQENVEQKE